MTDQRTQFLIQVLEKIGGPLTAAVAAGPHLESESANAQRVAELLNRSVQLGLSIAGQMNVRDEGQADGVHLSLAALSSPLMAGQYIVSGRVPGDAEIKSISTALQAVLTFADNFTPAADSTLRLENTEPGAQPADEALVHVQVLNAFVPVLQVVSEYSFGKPEGKMIQEITARLKDYAADLRETMFGDDLPVKTQHLVDIVLMKTLCGLYAAAHGAETRRLMSLPDQARANITVSIDPVWKALDQQIAMVRVIAEQIIPGGGAVPPEEIKIPEKRTNAPDRRAGGRRETENPASNLSALPAAVTALAGRPAAPQTNTPASPPATNPMAFFAPGAKNPDEDEDEDA